MALPGLAPTLPDIAPPPPRDPLGATAPSLGQKDASLMSGGPMRGPTIIVPDNGARIVSLTDMHRERSRRVRWPRLVQNRKNWNTFHMIQDWSAKIDGQSKLFFPDLPIAIHQAAAVLENQLVTFQNWFAIKDLGGLSVFDPDTLRLLVQHILGRLWRPGDEVETSSKFPTFLGDSLIVGLIEGEITWKIFGVDSERIAYMLESIDDENHDGAAANDPEVDFQKDFTDPDKKPERVYERITQQIKKAFIRTFRLGMDLVPFEDSYPDPSALNLFHIHEVTRHVSELRNNPDYDPQVIDSLSNYVANLDADRDKAIRAGVPMGKLLSDDPNQVRVREFWGDIVEPSTGKYLYRNCFCTTVNGKLLRPPTPNPQWHGCRPLVRAPLLRTPLSPIHKAVVDHAVPAAEAENEMGALMVDGGIASVWGTRQARPDLLADPTTIAKGIPPSFTAVLKRGAPLNAKFLERVDEGTVTPQYGMEMMQRMGRAREVGMATPSFPNENTPRQAPATEAVLADQQSSNLYENIANHIEQNLIEPGLQLIWLTMWQGLDDFSSPEMVEILGPERAALLQTMSTEERFYLFANNVKFDVSGLRNILTGINDFRKLTTATQSVVGNPMLQAAFVQRFDPARMVEKMIRAVNLDPTEIEWRASDSARRAELLAILNPQPQGGTGVASPQSPPGSTVQPGETNAEPSAVAPPNPSGFRGAQV